MIHTAVKLSRAGATVARTAKLGPSLLQRSPPSRLVHDGINGSNANPVALQMINYALSHARSQKSDESYAQGLLVLEQCLSTQPSEGQDPAGDNSRGIGNFDEAMDKLQKVQDLTSCSIGVRVAALEALVGLHLELEQDDTSSVLADKFLELLVKNEPGSNGGDSEVIHARARAVKGLVELVHGNTLSLSFEDLRTTWKSPCCFILWRILTCVTEIFVAKDVYQNVIQGVSKNKEFSNSNALAACNMSPEEVSLAATCALGQLEAHLGNFADAEEILTRALTITEEHFGSHHPKVGVVLTCIALMFRRKAMLEHSSSLLIQEGLYRRAIELLKAPPFETKGTEAKVDRSDIVALARGGYAEVLCVQQNRKDQGEKAKRWAEAIWRNRRLSLAQALDISNTNSEVPIIDARISRVL
ncbi:Tetratricopeptide repeat-like superfamily protein [Prunus dulcis]|uniref:Tetratricopeptide repeat-like superfamily protein n=1 Tax=Prunus dulcis TaxID=3755 RepID=A0A4Y1RQN9_PRUDU|nr:Tetratricopeptide repeat-like superfamily protein [Prunus dulcis]